MIYFDFFYNLLSSWWSFFCFGVLRQREETHKVLGLIDDRFLVVALDLVVKPSPRLLLFFEGVQSLLRGQFLLVLRIQTLFRLGPTVRKQVLLEADFVVRDVIDTDQVVPERQRLAPLVLLDHHLDVLLTLQDVVGLDLDIAPALDGGRKRVEFGAELHRELFDGLAVPFLNQLVQEMPDVFEVLTLVELRQSIEAGLLVMEALTFRLYLH